MSARIAKVIALVLGASFLLTACDPPMPPEVRAALAEQSYTCELGDTQLSAPESVAAVAGDWKDSVEFNCPGMTITPVTESASNVELQIGAVESKTCVPYARVPFAIDAIVLAVNLPDITGVNFSSDAIAKIWSGEITSWNDPVLSALNPNYDLPAMPISFGSELSSAESQPLIDWLQRLGGASLSLNSGTEKLASLSEGGLVLTKYSSAMAIGAQLAAITAEVGSDGVLPEIGSLNSGASMLKISGTDGLLTATINPDAKPIAPDGVAVAAPAYQAVTVLNLNLCGIDSLKTRAAARYLLRQDSQGSLGLSTVVGLPENVRIIALTEVSKGLPEPEITGEPAP